MINEELNTALYEKMFAEQETCRAQLRSQSQEESLNHVYEYTMREDILMPLLDAFMNFSTEGSNHDQSAVYKKSLDHSRIK